MLACSRGMYSLACRGRGPKPALFREVDPVSNMPTNSATFGLLLCGAWLLYFFGACLTDPVWFGKFSFDVSELPIVTVDNTRGAVPVDEFAMPERCLLLFGQEGPGLTDAALAAIGHGRMTVDTPLETLLRHLDHLISRLGEDRVGFGSDFDGAMIPAEIGSAAGLPALVEAMRAHGYDEPLLRRLGTENWLRVLEKTIG